ncbi:MAG: hypothetical protein ACI4JE_02550 [Ruminococcus sp.]
MTKRKFIALFSGVIMGAAILSGCGMSDAAKSAQNAINALPDEYTPEIEEQISSANELYDNLSEEDKKDVDKKRIDNLIDGRKKYSEELSGSINEKIDALTINLSSSDGLKSSYEAVREIMTEIENTPEEADEFIQYEALGEKVDSLFEKCNTIDKNLRTDGDAVTSMTETVQLMQYTSSTSTLYSYCVDISSELSKMTGVVSKVDLQSAIDDFEDGLLYDDVVATAMGPYNVFSAVLDLSEAVLDYYEPYTTGIDMDTIREDLSTYTDTILTRSGQK